ncbi:MAG: acetamidase/formamidase family protein [Armatimonadota bacterium]|nr:MAG: acetamidase/formamidase family protein [Armatimonadota bacterium]
MQRFFTGRLDGPQCSGNPLEPIGEVELGQTFVIEASLEEEREPLGPVFIRGVQPGDGVAIHVEDIQVGGDFGIDPDHGMLPEILDRQRVARIEFDVLLEKGELRLPGGIRLPLSPMIGCLTLAAMERCPNAWDHGGNMDVNEIRKGATVYIRAQREGGLLALGDLHAFQGDGEISGTDIEVGGEAKVTVNVSDKFPCPRPVIEVEDRIITVGMGLTYWAAVRSAVRDMTYLLMEVLDVSLEEANSVAMKAGSLRNGAIWMMSDHHLITMVERADRYPRIVFLDLPLYYNRRPSA